MATVLLHGNKINTNSNLPNIGEIAPEFILVNKELENVGLKNFEGKLKLLSVVPSLDTPVCALSTQKFNALPEKYEDLEVLIVSADLPFAMERFCSAEDTKKVTALSMMRSRDFAEDYGVLIEDGPLAGITARAIILIDRNNQIIYTELVEEISNEPDYDGAAAAIEAAS